MKKVVCDICLYIDTYIQWYGVYLIIHIYTQLPYVICLRSAASVGPGLMTRRHAMLPLGGGFTGGRQDSSCALRKPSSSS